MIHEKAAIGFDRAGDQYERGRPEYPQSAVDFLISKIGITSSSTVVDLGAGTGKFTKLLLPTKAKILAVEPVEGMRNKFSALLPTVTMLDGTAETIPLPNHSVNAVIVAQAFHWFNGPAALREIHRVLKPNGRIGLIWNSRDESLNWVNELTKIIDPHEGGAPRYKSMNWKEAFDASHLFSPLELSHFSYVQQGTVETIVDRIGSISFISALHEAKRNQVLDQVRGLVNRYLDNKTETTVSLPYRTDVYWCQRL